MNRTLKCAKFQLTRLFFVAGAFTGFYLVIYFAALLTNHAAGAGQTMTMNYGMVSIFYLLFIFTLSFGGLYNNLLLFSNTRRAIVGGFIISCSVFSAIIAVLSFLNDLMNSSLGKLLHVQSSTIFTNVYHYYKPGLSGTLSSVLWYFGLMLMISTFSLFYGSLIYKIGKKFIAFFWCGFGLLSMFSSLLSRYITGIVSAVKFFFGIDTPWGVYYAALHFFIVAVILCVITWLINYRQPQKA